MILDIKLQPGKKLYFISDLHLGALSCGPIKGLHSELEEVIHPEILGNLYAKAMLKIATVVALENYETFEDIAKSIIQKSESKLHNTLKNRAKNFNYWKKNGRINNADFTLIASLLVEDNQTTKLSKDELGALNLVYLAIKMN